MAVTSVVKLGKPWSGGDALGSKRSFTVTYLVTCDDPEDGPDVVLGAAQLPSIGDAYNTFGNDVDASAYLKDRKVTQVSVYRWRVACEYSTPDSGSGGDSGKPRGVDDDGNVVDDLDLEADDISVDTLKMTRVAEKGIVRGLVINNNFLPGNIGRGQWIPSGVWRAITNSANVPLDPPLTIDYTRMVLRITRNAAAYNADLYKQFIDTVNDRKMVINRIGFTLAIEPYTGKVESISTTRVQRGLQIRYRTTFEFHIDDVFGWRPDVLDRGFMETPSDFFPESGATSNVPVQHITTDDGNPVNEPMLLDGQGGRLGANADVAITSSVFIRYTVYPEVDWTQLGIWN